MLSLGYHLRQSQKPGFVFSEKSFCRFQGVQPAPGSGAGCPFLRHLCFRKVHFHVLGTCHKTESGCLQSQNRAFVFLEKSFCQNWDIEWSKPAQNGPKLHKYLCACTFLGHSYFEFKCFAQIRTCKIMYIFITCNQVKMYDTYYAHK